MTENKTTMDVTDAASSRITVLVAERAALDIANAGIVTLKGEIRHLITRVRELEALTVEPPSHGTLTEDDVVRIAEQTYAATVMRYSSGLPPWSKLALGMKQWEINRTRDCLSAVSYRVPKAIPKVHTETIGERADLLDSLDAANARIATLEAEITRLSSGDTARTAGPFEQTEWV
jgi:uncharacterized small protein (DUF1192 family)